MNSENTPPTPPSRGQDGGNGRMPNRNFAFVLLLMLLTMVLIHLAGTNRAQIEKISYKPEFVNFVNEGKISKVTVYDNGVGGNYLEAEKCK